MAVQYRKPVDDEVPWQQRLANYAQNRTAGQDEYKRALEVFRGKSAAGDTEGANSAKTWADQVNTAIGGTGSQYGDDVRSQLSNLQQRAQTPNAELSALQQQIKERVNRTPQQFSYDKDNDPAYKAALESARQNTQTAAGNIAADMNKRGLLNSTITQDRGNQAAAQEYNRVTNEVLPQLINQAYQRYQGDRQAENQQLNNMLAYTDYLDRSGQQQFRNDFDLLSTANNLNQQDLDNQYRSEVLSDKQKQDRINLANYLTTTYGIQADPKMDSQVAYDQVKGLTPLAMQEYLQRAAVQNAGLTGLFNGQETMDARKLAADIEDRKAQLDISRMNAGTSAASAANSAGNAAARLAFDREKFQFDKDQASGQSQRKQMSQASYSEFLQDLPRIDSIDEGNQLISLYRQQGVDEATIANMQKAINSKFKE
ncbi:hypothetical protein DVH26_07800 [Paenibacillus sp. H1-7]|uniref:hypothetical protein n=1 Tax=Paenibacillus sp. H1-7 TaxID=2282849 RepID=UPI001EF768C8|nr:hypothetical protein [Paenibacillus sp. H1-7]ULL14361.1 hypothetical protein DVH26_07800 [Paenibacillus sp. H1-7]